MRALQWLWNRVRRRLRVGVRFRDDTPPVRAPARAFPPLEPPTALHRARGRFQPSGFEVSTGTWTRLLSSGRNNGSGDANPDEASDHLSEGRGGFRNEWVEPEPITPTSPESTASLEELLNRPVLSDFERDFINECVRDDELVGRGVVDWRRSPAMDAYAGELIDLHRGSLELEWSLAQITSKDDVEANRTACNGRVQHLGAGVILEKNTIGVDPDSEPTASATKSPLWTITRSETRSFARACLGQLKEAKRKVVGVGHPGIGKTRGALAYALQELLWQRKVVMRAGYKDERVYLFVPCGPDGTYKAWSVTTERWKSCYTTQRQEIYTLLDPPEAGDYKENTSGFYIRFCSNNAAKHYHNVTKDFGLLLTSMPTTEEMLLMAPHLWSGESERVGPGSDGYCGGDGDLIRAEVLRRIDVVGCIPRFVFNWKKMTQHMKKSIGVMEQEGFIMDLHYLMDCFRGDCVRGSTISDTTDASSKMCFVNVEEGSNREEAVFSMTPLATAVFAESIRQRMEGMKATSAFKFEDAGSVLLMGGDWEGENFVPCTHRLLPGSKKETAVEILRLPDGGGGALVRACANFEVLDFATSPTMWYNAKGDSQPRVKSGAFATLLLRLKWAKKTNNDTKLTTTESMPAAKIQLCFVRRTADSFDPAEVFIDERGKNHESLAGEDIEEIFKRCVDVRVLETSKFKPSNLLDARLKCLTVALDELGLSADVGGRITAAGKTNELRDGEMANKKEIEAKEKEIEAKEKEIEANKKEIEAKEKENAELRRRLELVEASQKDENGSNEASDT